jgi:hypothetical protein
MKNTLELAIANFCVRNKLSQKDVNVTVIDENRKVIIRVPNGNVQMLRNAAETVYFGELHPDGIYDLFTFQCTTGKSGILEYNEQLNKK